MIKTDRQAFAFAMLRLLAEQWHKLYWDCTKIAGPGCFKATVGVTHDGK